MAVRDFGTRRTRRLLVPLIISIVAVLGTVGAFLFTGFDLARFERAQGLMPSPSAGQQARYQPLARTEWRIVRANLETRLKQTNPLELGAVWSTRTGQICGLVNGRGSFGGLTAMSLTGLAVMVCSLTLKMPALFFVPVAAMLALLVNAVLSRRALRLPA